MGEAILPSMSDFPAHEQMPNSAPVPGIVQPVDHECMRGGGVIQLTVVN
jgi:hypothetical protein